jgi:hypothetical protein
VPELTLQTGEVVLWERSRGARPQRVRIQPPRGELRRHHRKYAAGELGPDISFYFRGPEGKLNLRAQNLSVFSGLAEGVDDETWLYHLRRREYSRWFREIIKDDELASEAARAESDAALSAADSRALIKRAIEQRYTAPA